MTAKESIQEITAREFSEIINDNKNSLVVIDFYAEWCMPCLMIAPFIESMAEKHKKVKFCKINVDEAGELSSKYNISHIPCIIFFKEGKETDRVTGSSEEEIEKKIAINLK